MNRHPTGLSVPYSRLLHVLGRALGCAAKISAVTLASSALWAQSDRVVLTPSSGFSLNWDGNNGGFSSPDLGASAPDNAALASKGVTTFASSNYQPGGFHDSININDGFYGNSSSWIADFAANPPDTNKFVGLAFGKTVQIQSIAWSRDNGDTTEPACGGTCTDRAVGVYTLQFTQATAPGVDTPETSDPTAGWVTIGTVEYKAGADSAVFSAYLRHRFDVSQGGNAIAATGLRIKVSDVGTCIDEIEVNPPADLIPPISNFLTITNTIGYAISWDLNDGKLYTTNSPAPAPINRALASKGTTAFGSSEYGHGVHFATNVIDGLYGNSHSWIPDFTVPDPDPFIGLNFGGTIELRNIAWSRDNGDNTDCCGGELTDRALGIYTIQITRVTNPGKATTETGDPSSGWATIGQINYRSAGPPFTPSRRHRFDLATSDGKTIVASGIRIKVPNANTDIDEIEVNAHPAVEVNLADNLAITPSGGYEIVWDGNDGDFYSPAAGARTPPHDGLATAGAVAFGSSELNYGIHFIHNINDGHYGNSSSWISDRGVGGGSDQDLYVGIAFPKQINVSVLAFGRDNGDTTEAGCGGTCTDRSLGVYTLQVTTVASPGTNTTETGSAATGWETVGTIEYKAAAAPYFNPSLRHAYNVTKGGQPIPATGIRLKVSDGNIAIDEIEINPQTTVAAPPITDLLAITSATGFAIGWDGNDGLYYSPEANAPARGNAALATRGGVAFGSSQVDLGVHFIKNVNDGIYGNTHSWIPKFTDPADTNPSIGIRLPGLLAVRSIAWGRDNGDNTDCCGGTLTDRAVGTYTLQVSRVANAGTDTPETGDAGTGWQTVGTLEYKGAFTGLFSPYLRHQYSVSQNGGPILAAAIRLKLSSNQMDIDEIEINSDPVIDQNVLVITPQTGFTISWDGNNGDYNSPASPALAPNNDALASNGSTAIGSSQLDLGVHFIKNVNDGAYGNTHSWIADFINGDTDPWVGIVFAKSVAMNAIAWGRDNGDTNDCCGGTLTDRAAGTYILQFTQVAKPDATLADTGDPTTGWNTIGQLEYRGAGTDSFTHALRHQYQVAQNGAAINATAMRIKLSSNTMDIDEIEVNPQLSVPVQTTQPRFDHITLASGQITLEWQGTAKLEASENVNGGWAEVSGAASGYKLNISGGPRKFFRLRQ